MTPLLLPPLLPSLLPSLLLALRIAVLDPAVDPPHMVWADRLIRDLHPGQNRYGSRPTVLEWQGVNGAALSRNRTVCSSFVIRLLRQAYGLSPGQIRSWFGSAAPSARQVAQTIRQGRRFQRIATITALRRGDLIAIDYQRQPAPEPGPSPATGHLMLAAAEPQPLAAGQEPATGSAGPGTAGRRLSGDRWLGLLVIDSSRTGHGPGDTRLRPDGSWGAGGVGRGRIGLLVDSRGRIQGYRWSLTPRSRLFRQQQHALVVGRLCLEACPADER